MPHHFYLPELDSNANIPVPKETALWNNNDKKIILGVSDGINIDENAKTRGISSIPDVWARPLLFQSALKKNSRHPLKPRCIQEWRGLLSILALHKVKPELSSNFEVIAVQPGDEKFSNALRNLAPAAVQLEKGVFYDWMNILMIRFDGIPIGAFSPVTLVYSGADYASKVKDKAFSFKDSDGFLTPPTTREDGLEYIGEWLFHLQKRMNSLLYSEEGNIKDRFIVENINNLIDDWLKEIRDNLGLKPDEPIDIKQYKVSEDPIEPLGNAPFLTACRIYVI